VSAIGVILAPQLSTAVAVGVGVAVASALITPFGIKTAIMTIIKANRFIIQLPSFPVLAGWDQSQQTGSTAFRLTRA
jgi:hypothetical protein